MVTKIEANLMKLHNVSFKMVYSLTSADFGKIQYSKKCLMQIESFGRFCLLFRNSRAPLSVYVMFSNMAENNSKIISFKTAQEVFKNLNLGQKRQLDKGNNDYEIIEEILHHEGVELINFSDKNLDPDKLVSCIILFLISMVWKGLVDNRYFEVEIEGQLRPDFT